MPTTPLLLPEKTGYEQNVFQNLPDQLRQTIWEKGLIQTYESGDCIVSPGDTGDAIRFLLFGKASVLLRSEEGQDITVELLQEGDLIGEISYLTGRPSPLNSEVIAQEYCKVLEISGADFEAILKNHPDCAVSVLRMMARKVIKLDQNLCKNIRKKRALQALISRQDHLFPDYFVSETVRRRVSRQLEQLAEGKNHILITGETGVGKEFMAHAIYGMSPHYKRIFLYLDLLRPFHQSEPGDSYCELPQDLADATEEQTKTFFGSEENRGDGRLIEIPGYLELTEEGTLLVRGVEQLTQSMQLKLLRALKTGLYRRSGARANQSADFRLIGTTNLDISEISQEKHPLLRWLFSNSLAVPPLRKRRKEIPALVQHYVHQYCQELRKDPIKIPKDTIKALVTYSWPGNDRELATTLKRAVLLAEDGVLRKQDIYFDLRSIEGEGKINLLRLPGLRAAMESPLFPAVFQSAAAPFFFILLILLFLGPVDPKANIGGLFSWAVGWPTMIFGSFIWARFWCSLCPMGTLSHLAKRVISYDVPLPPFLKQKSDWIIAGSALFVIWLEVVTDIRNSPVNTGLLLLSILLLALIISVIFEKQSWCRYLCPLGGMMGLFAKTSPLELRADRHICASQCTSNECFTGTATMEGCPFGQMVPTLRSNRFCKLCGSCIKNCPHSAVRLNLRVPGREIWEIKQIGAITAMLVIGMYGGLLSEMMHKMSAYTTWTFWAPFQSELILFTIFFTLIIIGCNLVTLAAAYLSSVPAGETVKENFARYGLALLPVVLTGYMAFHLYYLINLGVYFPIIMVETFKFEIFRPFIITVAPDITWKIQQLLLWLGIIGSLVLMFRLSRGKNTSMKDSLLEFLPHAVAATAFFVVLMYTIKGFFYY